MTKKILIDEAVLKQALKALEPLTINAELRGDSFPEGNELHRMADAGFKALTALREALEVNNKGVNALAEQPDYSICPACGGMAADPIVPVEARQQAAEPVARCPQDIIDAITAYGDARADQDAINAPTTSHERLADCIRLVRGVLTKQMAPTRQDGTNGVVALQPLTDEQCDAIYTALDEWCHEVDSYDFGLPAFAGGGMEKGREIIRAAYNITSNKGE